ncbi:MAG: hypothetical protein IPO89_07475 [Actinomycetales bacterium]|nr:hypothetical protein [Candidatus Lutibacillus vidarii]
MTLTRSAYGYTDGDPYLTGDPTGQMSPRMLLRLARLGRVMAHAQARASHAMKAWCERAVSEANRLVEGSDRLAKFADAQYRAGKMKGAVAEFKAGGRSFIDASGSPTQLHPRVSAVLDSIPARARAPWHGGCAEPRCVSQALRAGVDPKGGSMRAVQIGDKGQVPHGAVRPPCQSCAFLRDAMGYHQ